MSFCPVSSYLSFSPSRRVSIELNLFQIHGAVMAFSESLLYSGYQDLDLTRIFMASIFVGSSGAMMDLTVDIAAAVHEVVEKRPDLSRREAAMSGIRVGRAAMGTMTTTLLLAYSGGFLGLLMVFKMCIRDRICGPLPTMWNRALKCWTKTPASS